MRVGMLIDLQKCIGCGACAMICRQIQGAPAGVLFSRVLKYENGPYPHSRLHTLPVLCMHCAVAPCLRACPTGATRREADGAVMIDAGTCIGCRACMQACPYEARRFLWTFRNYWPDEEPTPYEILARKKFEPGTVAKCDFCRARRAQGREPGCVEACPTAARVFGDMEDQDSKISRLLGRHDASRLRPELGTEPAVWYRCLPGATPQY